MTEIPSPSRSSALVLSLTLVSYPKWYNKAYYPFFSSVLPGTPLFCSVLRRTEASLDPNFGRHGLVSSQDMGTGEAGHSILLVKSGTEGNVYE